MAETPGLLPTLTGDTTVRTKIGVILSIIGACALAVWSWAVMYFGQRDLARISDENSEQIKQLVIEQRTTNSQMQDLRLELARLGMVGITRQPTTRGP